MFYCKQKTAYEMLRSLVGSEMCIRDSDYDAAVMAGGHCGFGLGATPNAVANMEAVSYTLLTLPTIYSV